MKLVFWTTFDIYSFPEKLSSLLASSAIEWIDVNINLASRTQGKFLPDRNVKIKRGPFFRCSCITWRKDSRKDEDNRDQSPPLFFCMVLGNRQWSVERWVKIFQQVTSMYSKNITGWRTSSGKQSRKGYRLLIKSITSFHGIPNVVSGVIAIVHHWGRERLDIIVGIQKSLSVLVGWLEKV